MRSLENFTYDNARDVRRPTVTGTLIPGQTLTAAAGELLGLPGITYQWKRDGVAIGGATAGTYALVAADSGKTVTVTVTTADGSRREVSAATPVVPVLPPPANSVVPAITGTAQVEETLTASTGTWTGTPTGYSYQWKRGVTNVGTDQNTYSPVAGDIGSTITVTVTATNAGGSTPATSDPTDSVLPLT